MLRTIFRDQDPSTPITADWLNATDQAVVTDLPTAITTAITALKAEYALPTGASELGFHQEGTGAVARTLQSKARERVSVKDFGAIGDGVANDTAAFQSAIDYVTSVGGVLVVPPGTYLVGELYIVGTSGIDLIGYRHPHTNQIGSVLIYQGTGRCLSIAKGDGSFMYRVFVKNIGIFFAQNAQAGIYGKNLQECTIENVGVWAESKIVQYAFDLDGAGIVNIDNCVSSRCVNGINMHFGTLPNSQASGGVNITRNNIFFCTDAIICGYTLQLNIEKNWIEGFQNGVLIDNADPKLRIEVAGLFVCNNTFLQSTSGLTETRVMKVVSSDDSRPIRLVGTIRDNYCVLNSSGATRPSYAVSVAAASNSTVVDGRLTVENNEFYGVAVAGVFNDSGKVVVSCTKNKVRDGLWGAWLQEYNGSGARLFDMQALTHISTPVVSSNSTSEVAARTIAIPANHIGPTGALRITANITCDNNANAKAIRLRLNDSAGPIIAQHSAANGAFLSITTTFSNRDNVAQQFSSSVAIGGAVSTWSNSGALTDTRNDVSLLLTYQKAVGGDALTIESITVETIQP